VRAAAYALIGFVLWMLGAEDLLLGGPIPALFALSLALVLEGAAVYRAIRNLRGGASIARGSAIGALLVAGPVVFLTVSGLFVLFSPQQ
jgi:hypothetical protein